MRCDVNTADALFLHEHLTRDLERLESELVHTDKRSMQRELAAEVQRLRELIARIFSP
jgi:hypothetical protein